MTRSELLRFLRAQPWAVEASVNREGKPEAAVIGVTVNEKEAEMYEDGDFDYKSPLKLGDQVAAHHVLVERILF